MALSVSIELVSSSARVISVKSAQPPSVTHLETLGPIDRTPGIPGSDNNLKKLIHGYIWSVTGLFTKAKFEKDPQFNMHCSEREDVQQLKMFE